MCEHDVNHDDDALRNSEHDVERELNKMPLTLGFVSIWDHVPCSQTSTNAQTDYFVTRRHNVHTETVSGN